MGCRRTAEDGKTIPDFDSIWAFGPNIGNDDLELIREMDRLCFDYGLDPLSCGASIAAYMEVNPWMKIDEVKGYSRLGMACMMFAGVQMNISVPWIRWNTAHLSKDWNFGYDPREMPRAWLLPMLHPIQEGHT
ncbi:MAG: aldehyde ferredoxin oxidoreductase C-terminal domain-containing protein [Methanolobus sp.]